MGLSTFQAEMIAILGTLPESGTVESGLPTQISNERTTIVYPAPGQALPAQHTGRAGKPMYQVEDEIIIERHVVIQKDDGVTGNADSLPALEAIRAAVFQIASQGDRIVLGITTDHYGFGTYGTADTFMFRLRVAVRHLNQQTL